MPQLLVPDLVFDAQGRPADGPILVAGGRVLAAGPAAREQATGAAVVDLAGRLLVPGFTNAHSHAFQRALRGRVERRSTERPDDDFWSWRAQMYACALQASAEDIELLATWAYADMLRSGFVAVGEFHYLHHAPDGSAWGTTSSQALIAAAERVGVRLALLSTAYERGGPGVPPAADQRRFIFAGPDAFLAHEDAVRALPLSSRVTHGLAVHSVRACTRATIEALARYAQAHDLPLHVHACEQRKELEQCQQEHGMLPLPLLAEAGALLPRTVVVHATHIDEADVRLLQSSGAGVCLCPSTERNLGDGLCPIADLAAAGVPLSIGSDSHARIDVVDELRSLEDHERLRTERRAVLPRSDHGMAASVLPAATLAGPAALGLQPGGVSAGAVADLVAVPLSIEGRAHHDAALDAWLVGGHGGQVSDVWVDGERLLKDGRLTRLDDEALERDVVDLLKRFS